MNRQLSRADNRPRIHIWPTCAGFYHWSIGVTGLRHADAETPGRAIDAAIKHLGGPRPTVVIIEPPS